MKQWLLAALAVTGGVAQADYELRYFGGKQDALVEYATLYQETSDGKSNVVFAWCGDTDMRCDRTHALRKVVKSVPFAEYVALQAKASKITLKYLQDPTTGLARLERDLKAAKEGGKHEVMRELERQRDAAVKLVELMKPLAAETAGQLAQTSWSFRTALYPLVSAPEVNTDPVTLETRVLDLATFTDWIIVDKTPTRLKDAKAACEKLGGRLPEGVDYRGVATAFEASVGSTWAASFWLAGANFQTKFEQVKEPYPGGGYILKTVRIGYVNVPHVAFKEREGTVTTAEERSFVAETGGSPPPFAQEEATALDNLQATHAVVCLVRRATR